MSVNTLWGVAYNDCVLGSGEKSRLLTMKAINSYQSGYLAILFLLAVLCGLAQAAEYMSPGLTPEQVLAKLDSDKVPLVVDVRKPAEFGVAHIPSAINIPLAEIEDRLDEFKRDNGVLIYCINGTRTRKAEVILFGAGISSVHHLEGAFNGWIQGKHPIEKGGAKKSGW